MLCHVRQASLARSAAITLSVASLMASCGRQSVTPKVDLPVSRPVSGRVPLKWVRRVSGAHETVWTYDVVAAPKAAFLSVEAEFPVGTHEKFAVLDGGSAFVENVRVHSLSNQAYGAEVRVSEGEWKLPGCRQGCRVSYRFQLREAAQKLDDRGAAQLLGEAVQAPVSTWLLRPREAPLGIRILLRGKSAQDEVLVTGLGRTRGTPATYEAHTAPARDLPYGVVGPVRHMVLDDALEVVLTGAPLGHEAQVLDWVRIAARVVRAYYGRPPISRLLVILHGVKGARVGFGSTTGMSGASVLVSVGQSSTAETLSDDWILIHEMIHTALPELLNHRWLEEGLATYVEPVARAQAGLLTAETVWREWLGRMRQGLPPADDLGLNSSESWGRTYWGGALFCLSADIEIRERTGNRFSLRDALRAIVNHGGNIGVIWPIERVLAVGDEATGVSVLKELYARQALAPERVDLLALWQKLGVSKQAGQIIWDDTAPLAYVRRGLLQGLGTITETE